MDGNDKTFQGINIYCPLCREQYFPIHTAHIRLRHSKNVLNIAYCGNCTLSYAINSESCDALIYLNDYSVWGESHEHVQTRIGRAKLHHFQRIFNKICRHINPTKGKSLLDIGTGCGYMLDAAREIGIDGYGIEISEYAAKQASIKHPGHIVNGTLKTTNYDKEKFDMVSATDVLEHILEPVTFTHTVRKILKPHGHLLLTVPNIGSFTKRVMGKHWFHYKEEHVTYWNRKSLDFLMEQAGFKIVHLSLNMKYLNLTYYVHYIKKYPVPGFRFLSDIIFKTLPGFVLDKPFPNIITGEILLLARKI